MFDMIIFHSNPHFWATCCEEATRISNSRLSCFLCLVIEAICFCSETNSRAKNKLSSLFFTLSLHWFLTLQIIISFFGDIMYKQNRSIRICKITFTGNHCIWHLTFYWKVYNFLHMTDCFLSKNMLFFHECL